MLRSRIHLGTSRIHGSLRSTRHKSTLEDLTRQSRVQPPGLNPPTTYKSGTAKFSRILQWTLVPGVFGYMALYGDFGEHEHIFSPLRRYKDEFLQLSPEENRTVQSERLREPGEVAE